jgi:hypothetical protein
LLTPKTPNSILIKEPFETQRPIPLFDIDREACQLGLRAFDIGVLLAEVYMFRLYKDARAALWMIGGFVAGYDKDSADPTDDFAFDIALHRGVHPVCWGGAVPEWGPKKQAEEVARFGKEIVVHGLGKDREWFVGHELKCRFGKNLNTQ